MFDEPNGGSTIAQGAASGRDVCEGGVHWGVTDIFRIDRDTDVVQAEDQPVINSCRVEYTFAWESCEESGPADYSG